ncbi:MAG: hypothetical protein ACM3PU_17335 [Gemmatimonadota bacterium]
MQRRLLGILLGLLPLLAAADGSPLGMSYVDTKDLKLVYLDPLGFLAPYAIRTYTNSLNWQRRTFGWTPSEPTTILLRDSSDYGNAITWAAPRNLLYFDVAPLSHAFETYPASERLYTLMNHEMVHVVQGDVANDEDRTWRRRFFGKVAPQPQNPESLLYGYLTVPRFNVPRWWLEGSAVFMETWMAGGLGRAQGGYDEMVFRAMVKDGAHFYDPLGLESRAVRVDFQIGANAYLYGTRFMTWLAYTYSPEQVVQWIRRDAGSKRHYADQFQHVFGLPLDRAWQDWVAFEREFQRRNLERIREHPITPHHTLVARALGSISRMFYDESTGVLYGAFRYPGVVEHVGALNTRDGSIRRLADIKRAMLYRVASFAYDPGSGTAFYTNDNLAWRDLMAVNVKTGEERVLLQDWRIGDIAFNPADRSLIGVRHTNGLAMLVRIPYPYSEWKAIYTFPYGVVPFDLDISPDGSRLSASMSEVGGEQYLRVWKLERLFAGDVRPLSEFRFGQSVPECFVFSKDGRYLYGSSYYSGVSNIFRYEVATGTVEAVSNAESGFFRPIPLADGRLVVLTYTSDGFVPAIIDAKPVRDVSAISFLGAELAAKHPIVTTWQVQPPSAVDPDKLVIDKGPYDPKRNVTLVSAYPVLQGYRAYGGIGYRLNFEDPLRYVNLGITAAYTPSTSLAGNERAHFDAKLSYLGWRAGVAWNRSDSYDLFGPTFRARRGFATTLGYDDSLIYDEPRRLQWTTDVAYYNNLDALPAAQNIPAPAPRLLSGQTGLFYTNLRRSLGAVDDEKGWSGDIVLAANHASGRTVPQLRGDVDLGVALPIEHSSVWWRSAVGIADGDRSNPYANFYFGGFGNNYVDNHAVKRYRQYDSFPGFKIDELGGRSFARTMLELNLPPTVFESVGTPDFYLAWLRPAIFASSLWTEPMNASLRNRYASVGTQIDLRFNVLHWYDMTLSAGYAIGYRSGRRAGDEWMVSLKIM